MKILIINGGSTSIKYTLFKVSPLNGMEGEKIFSGVFQKKDTQFYFENTPISERDFCYSFNYFFDFLITSEILNDIIEIKKYGLRIVHGGKFLNKTVRINKTVLEKIKKTTKLAPLHNPVSLKIIKQIYKLNAKAKIYAVFDTSFHQTIPNYAHLYGLPQKISKDYQIKKYGFHGIVCQAILYDIEYFFDELPTNIIICHLGGGCSVTAIKNGESMDTSMGFTPLSGVLMTTRSGDIDAGIITYLKNELQISTKKVLQLLNQKSGLYGLTGFGDMKKIIQKAQKGNKNCLLAIDIFIYKIVKYIFTYYGVLQGLDVLVFSGGIGFGSAFIRKKIIKNLEILGFLVEEKKNENICENITDISAKKSLGKTLVIRDDENQEIIRQILKFS